MVKVGGIGMIEVGRGLRELSEIWGWKGFGSDEKGG
jgi:hypothetical protein